MHFSEVKFINFHKKFVKKGVKNRFQHKCPSTKPDNAKLGASWGVLGGSRGRLGTSWGRLGRFWGRLGAVLGRLGREDGYDWSEDG